MIRIFNGIRPAVVALILFPCISAVRATFETEVFSVDCSCHSYRVDLAVRLITYLYCGGGIIGGLVYTLWLKEKR